MHAQPQGAYLEDLSRMARETDARVESLVRPLSDAQLRWRPADGGWSIAEVLEHLCLAHDSYDAVLGKIVDAPDAPRADADAPWSATLAGGMLVRSFASDRRTRAPKIFRPGFEPRPDVLDAFLARERQLLARLARLARARTVDLRRVKLASPVTRLIRMNLGDALGVLVHHARRHLGQMVRVRARVGFPSG
jgi:uncharacterized damage-inducible protein DinB